MFLGIEIGGTKLQLGLGAGDGNLADLHRLPVDPNRGAEGIRTLIAEHAVQLLAACPTPVRAVGVGFGGPVDDRSRRCIKSHQVAGWDDFPLADWLEQRLGMPAVLGNDADLAGLAEASFGAGTGFNPVFYVNVGSGIGGALILDGKVHRGVGRGSGEIGHVWIEADLTSLDRQRCRNLEDGSSGWALQRLTGVPSVQALAQAIERGDAQAGDNLRLARRRLALALSHVIALLCPQKIVLGGGVSLLPEELFLAPLRRELERLAFPPFAGCWELTRAGLGEAVVVHGALAMARFHGV